MIQDQNGVCAVCFERPPIVVDHDHKTDIVRALLCNRCNTALGAVETDGWLGKALAYLKAWAENQGPTVRRIDHQRKRDWFRPKSKKHLLKS